MLGQALTAELQRRQHSYLGVARHQADRCLDVTDRTALLSLLRAVQPAVIINTVAQVDLAHCETNPGACYQVNARVSADIAQYGRCCPCYYVYISTDHYYSGAGRYPHREQDPVNLCNEYAITKYCGEQLALTHPQALVVRTNIVGFRHAPQRPTFVEWVIRALQQQQPITLFADVYTSSIDTGSFAAALLDLIATRPTGIINLASAEVASKQQFILALAHALQLPTHHTHTGSSQDHPGAVQRNNNLGLNVSLAEAQLGYALPNLQQVIGHLAKQHATR